MKLKCHQCGFDNLVNPGELLRSIESAKRRKASRENGKKGGRPRKCRKCGSKNVVVRVSSYDTRHRSGQIVALQGVDITCRDCGFQEGETRKPQASRSM